MLDAAERTLASATDEPYEPSVGRAASLVANVPAAIALERGYLAQLRGDTDRAVALASRALAELGEGEWMLGSIARVRLAMAEWLGGRLVAAEQAFGWSVAQWRSAGELTLAARGCHHLGLLQRAGGRLDAALATYRQVLEMAAVPGRPALPAAGIAHVGMAEIAYQRGELAAALEQATEGIALCRRFVYTAPLATGLVTLAWVRQATGDHAGALEAMGEAGQVAPSSEVAALLNPVPAQRARLLLAQGDVTAAARWTNQRGLHPDDQPSYPREPEYLVLARVLLAQQAPEQALGLLRWLRELAAAQARVGSVIEIQRCWRWPWPPAATSAAPWPPLAEALALACPEGYLRVFVDEGAPMAGLLGRLATPGQQEQMAAAEKVPPGYPARLLAAFSLAAARTHPARRAMAGLVEPLSERELEVLGLLAAGRSNQQIAEELVVALDTVKSTSATCSASSGRPTAPRPWPAPGSCSYSGRPARSTGR